MSDNERVTLLERFESKWTPEPNTGCWLWIGSIDTGGYGSIRIGKLKIASRVSYELHVGPIPDGMCVCHRCDVRSCVNPAHLFLGTHKANMDDKSQKGRGIWLFGERHPMCRIPLEQRNNIIDRVSAGEPRSSVAASVGCSEEHVGRIVRGASRGRG